MRWVLFGLVIGLVLATIPTNAEDIIYEIAPTIATTVVPTETTVIPTTVTVVPVPEMDVTPKEFETEIYQGEELSFDIVIKEMSGIAPLKNVRLYETPVPYMILFPNVSIIGCPSGWVTFDKNNFDVPAGEAVKVNCRINVPTDTEPGYYAIGIQVESENDGANTVILLINVLEDTIPPDIIIHSPEDGAIVYKPYIELEVIIKDNVGIRRGYIEPVESAKEEIEISRVSDTELKISGNIEFEQSGLYKITIVAEDLVGNIAEETITVACILDNIHFTIEPNIDVAMKPGISKTFTVYVKEDTGIAVRDVRLEYENLNYPDPRVKPLPSAWISINPKIFNIPANTNVPINVTISIPAFADTGKYYGSISAYVGNYLSCSPCNIFVEITKEQLTPQSPTTITTIVTPTTTISIKKPPVAIAGDDVTVYEGSEVTLSALASYDPDGTIVSYQWIDENGITISNSPILRYSFPVGTHVITLKVTDNDGLSSTDTVKVTVLAKEHGKPSIVISQSALSGEEGLLTVTIANTGDAKAFDVRVIERIPSEIVVSYVEGATSSGSLITWTGDLDVGEQHNIKHSLKLQTDQAIIPVTVKYKDASGKEYELSTNLIVQKPTQTIAPTTIVTTQTPPTKPQQQNKLPISEQTLIILTAIVVVGIVAVAVAIAMMKRKPPEIQIKE